MTVLPFYFSADFATTSAAEICVDASFNSSRNPLIRYSRDGAITSSA
jgi:hypothetical protein